MQVTDGQEEATPAPVLAPAEPDAAPFAWTSTKRAKLIKTYVDTGDLLGAQQAVGATPSDFNAQLRGNDAFRTTVEASHKDARQTLLLRAQSEALGGNDKLLTLFLKEEEDEDNLQQMSSEQLSQRIKGLLLKSRACAIHMGWPLCEHCGGLKDAEVALAWGGMKPT
jgi:hypothetical protein